MDIRLKGDWTDQIETDKWSFRVEVNKSDTILGFSKFSIHGLEARSGIWPVLINDMYAQQGGPVIRYHFADLVINGVYKGVFAIEEGFDNLALQNSQRRDGPIIRVNEDLVWEKWAYFTNQVDVCAYNIEPFRTRSVLKSPLLYNSAASAITALNKYICGEATVEEVFDLDLLASYLALEDVYASNHGTVWHNMRFYVNTITGKLEIIPFDDKILGNFKIGSPFFLYDKADPIPMFAFRSELFREKYFSALKRISGQFDWYIVSQVKNFLSGSRKNPKMMPYIKGLSDKDLNDLGAYISKLTTK